MSIKILLFLGALFAALSFAAETSEKVIVLQRQSATIVNKDCEKTKTCDLKQVSFTVEDYGDGAYLGTKFIAGYETETVGDLENYLFVQFIRGCVFTTAENTKTGAIETRFDGARRLFGEFQLFVHKDWDIDVNNTNGSGPAYYTNLPDANKLAQTFAQQAESYRPPKSLRHFFYMWNDKKDAQELSTNLPGSNNTSFFGLGRPQKPRLFIDDVPSRTSLFAGSEELLLARNVSLEFKTCLYRTGDVPTGVTAGETLGNPVNCIPWRSSFVFNHALKQFESLAEISPACTAAPDPKAYDLGQGYPVVPYFPPSR